LVLNGRTYEKVFILTDTRKMWYAISRRYFHHKCNGPLLQEWTEDGDIILKEIPMGEKEGF